MLLWAFRNAQKQIVYFYYPIEAVPQPDDNYMCTMRKARVREIATNIYRDRFAFGDLCAGYLIAVVAEKSFGDCVNFLYVLILTGVITWIECYLAKVLAKRNFPEDMQVSASKLEELGVDMTANDKDVKEMINEIFGGEKMFNEPQDLPRSDSDAIIIPMLRNALIRLNPQIAESPSHAKKAENVSTLYY